MVPWFNFTRRFKENFMLDVKLGEGAYGCTYKCMEKATGQWYAVKVLSKLSIETDFDKEAVLKEVKILRTVSPQNDNIVTLFGVFEDEESVYLLLELCTGGELFDVIKEKGSFSEADAAHIVRQVLRVTAECHLNGIAHRDLKPENFLYTSPGSDTIKAIDFGLSDFFTPSTRFTSIVGSPYYVAPEVLKKDYGPPVDVWSVGVLTYVLLCGGPPFWGETDEELFQAILNEELDLLSDPWPNVSESAKDLIRRLLPKNPKKRMTASQALSHPWVREGGAAPQIPLCYNIVSSLERYSKQSPLKRLFFENFAIKWENQQELQALKDQFITIDKDNSGCVSQSEFLTAIQGMRTGEHQQSVFSNAKIQEILQSLDSDGNGMLDYHEFIASVIHTLNLEEDVYFEKSALKAFNSLDEDGNGFLDITELTTKLGLEQEQVIQMMKEVDDNNDGQIDFLEFKQVLKDKRLRGSMDGGRPQHLIGMQPFAASPKTINLAAVPEAAPSAISPNQSLGRSTESLPALAREEHPDWIGIAIIKGLLQQAEDIKKEIKVKRKQMELEQQRREAQARVKDNLKNARRIPTTLSNLGQGSSTGKPATINSSLLEAGADPTLAISPDFLATLDVKKRISVSRVPIFSHPIDIED